MLEKGALVAADDGSIDHWDCCFRMFLHYPRLAFKSPFPHATILLLPRIALMATAIARSTCPLVSRGLSVPLRANRQYRSLRIRKNLKLGNATPNAGHKLDNIFAQTFCVRVLCSNSNGSDRLGRTPERVCKPAALTSRLAIDPRRALSSRQAAPLSSSQQL